MGLRTAAALVATFLISASPAAAHVVVESDFRNPVPLGAADRGASVTVVNEDPVPFPGDPEPPPFTVCNLGECGGAEGITLVPSCEVQGPDGRCASIDPGVFSVSATGTGGANSACTGMPFTITEIAPGKLSLNPAGAGEHIVLPAGFRCRIEFTIDVLRAPAGLQTTQVTEVRSTQDETLADDVGTDSVTFFDPAPVLPGPATQGPVKPAGPSRPAVDTTSPVLSALTLSRARFTARRGTLVSYTLSETATVRFRLARARQGRRVGGRCVRVTRANRGRRRCRRLVALRGSVIHEGSAGRNSLRIRGRLRGRNLMAGGYRLSAVATDAASNTSDRLLKRFRIVRR